ncbi:SMC-Scp complex subunit ScpB [Microaceticoccus formicicus]|uniref:SMC-Scp complex subunit ScpB n=1 Tax=Microaceticoccus formicicus TaxID=3118105 RepID=UPI003CD04E44|nr:SMC-Scp complex subunit ScpB [Peptoniphilaceae bacterium AMB_02]
MKMNDREYKSIIEALLFFWGDPLSIESISEILEITKTRATTLMEELIDEFQNNQRGTCIKKINNSYQLVTISSANQYIKKLMIEEDEKQLSNSAMETLSIIAYKQPVTRVEIESIRGVKSNSSINTLLERGLIKELGKLDRIGRPIIYGTTDEFLRVFGLENIEKLPNINAIDQISATDSDINET